MPLQVRNQDRTRYETEGICLFSDYGRVVLSESRQGFSRRIAIPRASALSFAKHRTQKFWVAQYRTERGSAAC